MIVASILKRKNEVGDEITSINIPPVLFLLYLFLCFLFLCFLFSFSSLNPEGKVIS